MILHFMLNLFTPPIYETQHFHRKKHKLFDQTMPHLLLSLTPFLTALSLLFCLSPNALAQNTIAECGPSLLALAPCGSFVQGRVATPAQTCCDNLLQLYGQKPTCICPLLNDTSLASSFPINTTLALQVPLLCHLHIDPSTCPGTSGLLSPPTHVSFGATPKSSDAGGISASPIQPRPRFMGFGFRHSAEARLKAKGRLLVLLTAATFTLLTRFTEPHITI